MHVSPSLSASLKFRNASTISLARRRTRSHIPRKPGRISFLKVTSFHFDSLESFVTFTQTPYGQRRIKELLESEDVPEEDTKVLANAVIPDFLLPDVWEVPVHQQGKDRVTFWTVPLDRCFLLKSKNLKDLECTSKAYLKIPGGSCVELRWTYGKHSTEDDYFFSPDVDTGLDFNIEAAGCITVVVLDASA